MSLSLEAPPHASTLIEALRGLGYTAATALADIIDNSIAAGATEVRLQFRWDGPSSCITITDDGCGMTAAELAAAMRFGSRDPLERRAPGDLGRFGLGLKTASFSQARRLTVASRKSGQVCCLRWDLDEITRGGGSWHMLQGPALGSEHLVAQVASVESGTVVAWELLDRLVTAAFRENDMLDLIDQVERHLAMVFHRRIGGRRRFRILVNEQEVRPWDPFLAGHPDTWSSPEERMATMDGPVVVPGARVALQGSVECRRLRVSCRPGWVDVTTGLLRLSRGPIAPGWKLAWSWPWPRVDKRGGASSCAYPCRHPQRGRSCLEN